VVFASRANNLVAGDSGTLQDIFIRDRQLNITELVNVTTSGVRAGSGSIGSVYSVSNDGRYVVFDSQANNLAAGDTDFLSDIFLRDRVAGTTSVISKSTAGVKGNGSSTSPSITPDGRFVVFNSVASNLVSGDTNGGGDVFVRDLQNGTTERVSISSTGAQGNIGNPGVAAISADGRYVGMTITGNTFDPDDTNNVNFFDVYLRDRQLGTTVRISKGPNGESPGDHSQFSSISNDGRYVSFQSGGSNLIAGGTTPGRTHVYVRDLQNGITTLVSKDASGAEANSNSNWPIITGSGQYIAFVSGATNYIPGDSAVWDIFLISNPAFSVLSSNPNPLGLIEGTFNISRHTTGQISKVTRVSDNKDVFTQSFDSAGRLTSFASGNIIAGQTLSGNISYDSIGRKQSVSFNTGLSGQWSYDLLNRITNITWSGASILGGPSENISEQVVYNPFTDAIDQIIREFGTFTYGHEKFTCTKIPIKKLLRHQHYFSHKSGGSITFALA
jgi:hypothetical protein